MKHFVIPEVFIHRCDACGTSFHLVHIRQEAYCEDCYDDRRLLCRALGNHVLFPALSKDPIDSPNSDFIKGSTDRRKSIYAALRKISNGANPEQITIRDIDINNFVNGVSDASLEN